LILTLLVTQFEMAKRYHRANSYSKENHRNPNVEEKTEDDDEDDLLSRKDVDRLSSLWKSLKEVKFKYTDTMHFCYIFNLLFHSNIRARRT